jgi:ABC-2 type transport system permease protein
VTPGLFFVWFTTGSDGERVGGLGVSPYVMVSMATFGALNALLGGGSAIAAERAVGWSRQLRVAGLRGGDYVVTKIVVAYLTATLGLGVVLTLGATTKGVNLSMVMWIEVTVWVLLGLAPMAALGVAVGYLVRPSSLHVVLSIGSILLALSGGLLNPIEHFPSPIRVLIEALPVYWAGRAGRSALQGDWVGWHGVAVWAAWTIALGTVAASAYRRDNLRPSAAGST